MKASHWGVALSLWGCMVLFGCGQAQQASKDVSSSAGKTAAANGKAANGAEANGKAANGNSANGAATNGNSANGEAHTDDATTVASAAQDDATDNEATEEGGVVTVIEPGPGAQKDAQEALIYAEPGDVIEFAEGEFNLTKTLSLDGIENVTIRGQGMDKTILKFATQQKGTGGEGIKITASKFTIEDLTLQDTPGDALKIEGAKGVTIRRIKTWWSSGPRAENGAYGIYPVLSEDVLVEHCVAECASDAGVYVGQSKNIIVRHNRAERNVAGIEIENCIGADVYENVATNNTGGLLVFSLPGLKLKNGSKCRVYNNKVYDNNHDNFASPGNMVATVPPGTGMSLMANDRVEVFDNEVRNHKSTNCYIISFFTTQRKFNDPEYDPYPEAISIYDNTFAEGGYDPQKAWAEVVAYMPDGKLPDIVYDGMIDEKKLVDGKLPPEKQIFIGDNGEFSFANIDFGKLLANEKPQPNFDREPYANPLPKLAAISIPGVK